MASHHGTLYTGVTNDLERRVHEHRSGLGGAFTKKYNVSKLVYYETTGNVTSAIEREKQIKAWRRSKRVVLIESMNPYWVDLKLDWNDGRPSPDPSLRSG
jgi:putative endonuclease